MRFEAAVEQTQDAATAPITAANVVVIGAGPAGIIAAASFARLGFQVDVYERRPRPRVGSQQTHNFTIVLNPKGLCAIRSVGIDTARLEAFPLLACVRHSPLSQAAHAFLRPANGTAANFERQGLVVWLLEEVERLYPSIRWHFGCASAGLDLEARRVDIIKDGTMREVSYDLLIAADGANSDVRAALQEAIPDFIVERREAALVYKRFSKFTSAVCDKLLEGGAYGPRGSVIHFYGVRCRQPAAAAASNPTPEEGIEGKKGAAGGTAGGGGGGVFRHGGSSSGSSSSRLAVTNWGFVTLVNHEDGTLSGGLSVHLAAQELLNSQQDIEAALQTLPLPAAERTELASVLAAAPWSWGGAWVRCSSLHAPGVVLVGDAAHSVSPSMGQGCNAGLEDVTVLQQLLTSLTSSSSGATCGDGAASGGTLGGTPCCGDVLKALPALYTRTRLADVHALVWLDEHARAFRGQLGMANRYFWMYLAHMTMRPSLHNLAPRLVSKPRLQLLWESPMAYSAVVKQMHDDLYTLASAAAVGVACAAVVAARVLPYIWRAKR